MATSEDNDLVGRWRTTVGTIFYPMRDEDGPHGVDEDGEDGELGVGGPLTRDGRSELWYEEIESQVDENTKTTRDNNKKITRIDERTAWIARIMFATLVALFVSVGAGLAVGLVL